MLKQRMDDIYEQRIQGEVENNNSHCNFYRIIRKSPYFEFQKYLTSLHVQERIICVNSDVVITDYQLLQADMEVWRIVIGNVHCVLKMTWERNFITCLFVITSVKTGKNILVLICYNKTNT